MTWVKPAQVLWGTVPVVLGGPVAIAFRPWVDFDVVGRCC